MSEYRTCIATECVNTKAPSENMNRLIDIKQEIVEHKALFHCWSEKSWIASALGLQSQTVAIVEYEDGTVHEHLPQEIRFTDGEAEKCFKNEKDGWNKIVMDIDNYPKPRKSVLFKTRDGRIFYGFCGREREWSIDIEEGIIKNIDGVVAWRYVDL